MRPESRILDIGCGVGRKAWAIIRQLSEKGEYAGIDIVPEAIQWCDENLRTPGRHVQSTSVNLFNQYYQHDGTGCASTFTFPYEDDTFDLVFASSVYTHMLPEGVANYLEQSRRLIKEEGRVISTFFVIDDVTLDLIERGRSVYRFAHQHEGYRVEHEECPEHVVAYEKNYLEQMVASCGLEITNRLRGSWCGRREGHAYQDIYLMRQKAS